MSTIKAMNVFVAARRVVAPYGDGVYIFNVGTQSRDVKYLHERGYKVRAIQLVDLFPHTEHVECVVLLSWVDN